jgi:hypothetical protein
MRSAPLLRLAPEPLATEFPDTLRPGHRSARLEVCPPQSRASRTWLRILRDWLRGGWQAHAAVGPTPRAGRRPPGTLPLDEIRQEFTAAVDDIRTPAGEALLDRIHFARGLHELWHLRAEVFRLVSLHHSQAEADERLTWLNRHFPTRSPRSGFGSLTSKDMWP